MLLEGIPINDNVMQEVCDEAIRIYDDGGFTYDDWTMFLDRKTSFDYRQCSDSECDIAYASYDDSVKEEENKRKLERHLISDVHQEVDEFCDYVNSATEFYIRDSNVSQVMWEGAMPYFASTYSLEDSALTISDRVNTYLSEIR